MNSCVFCRIVKNEIPSEKIYEDEEILAFKDIYPKAPVHILVIPKKHIGSLAELTRTEAYTALGGKMLCACARIAESYHLDKGYRVVTNVGEHGGQSEKHLHFHILGGEQLSGDFA